MRLVRQTETGCDGIVGGKDFLKRKVLSSEREIDEVADGDGSVWHVWSLTCCSRTYIIHLGSLFSV